MYFCLSITVLPFLQNARDESFKEGPFSMCSDVHLTADLANIEFMWVLQSIG